MMFIPLMLLAMESSEVIALRTIKLMFGGEDAAREVSLMIGEKFDAAFQATAGAGREERATYPRYCAVVSLRQS